MRFLLALICLAAIIVAGCTTEEKYLITNNYYGDTTQHQGEDSSRVHIVYPTLGATFDCQVNWVQRSNPNNNGCTWFCDLDTTFSAVVAADLPERAINATCLMRYENSNYFQPYSIITHPSVDTFSIPFYSLNSGSHTYFNPDTIYASFKVQILTADSDTLVSPIRNFAIVLRLSDQFNTRPDAPTMDTVAEQEGVQQLYINWCPSSPNVTKYLLYYQAQGESQADVDTIQNNQNGTSISDYLPFTRYSIWTKAMNTYGISPSSDTLTINTAEPTVPTYLSTALRAGPVVELRWQNHVQYCDSLLLSRRDSVSTWTTIRSFASDFYYLPSYFEDTTVVAHHVYFYRLGNMFSNGIWWMTDSAGVWIP